MASGIYLSALEGIAKGAIDFDTDTFKAVFVTSSYTPDFDAHDYRNDVTNEVSGTGYSAGGPAVTMTVNAKDTANNRVDITMAVSSLPSSSITARGAAIYKARGGASSADDLVSFIDFGSDYTSANGAFNVSNSTFRFAT